MTQFDLWGSDPESFIEHGKSLEFILLFVEDENFFVSEFDVDSEYPVTLLAYITIEKLLEHFFDPCISVIKEIVEQYMAGSPLLFTIKGPLFSRTRAWRTRSST